MKLKKIIYIVFGCIGLALGAVGAAVPLLPAFPFLLLATICFANGSDKFHSWFISTKLYRDNLADLLSGRGMTIGAKIRASIALTVTMSIGFFILHRLPIAQIILAAIWLLHIIYFIFFVKRI